MTPSPDPDSETDLRSLFAHLREAEQAQAPAREALLRRRPSAASLPRLVPVSALLVAVVATGFLFWRPLRQPSLSEILPTMFDQPVEPLFPGLGTGSSLPSDSLLPAYLTITTP